MRVEGEVSSTWELSWGQGARLIGVGGCGRGRRRGRLSLKVKVKVGGGVDWSWMLRSGEGSIEPGG